MPPLSGIAALEAIRSHQPVWLEDLEQDRRRYLLIGDPPERWGSRGWLPVVTGGTVATAIGVLRIPDERFTPAVRTLLHEVARLCAGRIQSFDGSCTRAADRVADVVQSVFEALAGPAILLSPLRSPSGRVEDFRIDAAAPQSVDVAGRRGRQLVGLRILECYPTIAGKPLWQLIGEMSPAELIKLIDFRYITDCITPEEGLALLEARAAGKAERMATLRAKGYPAYTTSAGWLGYSDAKLERLCREAVAEGFDHVKLKVGRSVEDDVRRAGIARTVLGPERKLMIDANQVWEVGEAIAHLGALVFADPWFIEEPTSPDDVEGHRQIREAVHPLRVATGEMCQNRVVFKQFIMRGAIDVVQIDACRLGGVNEVLAVLLMAAKYELPVCPHAGGVGLCEYVQHLAMADYLCFAGTTEGRVIEFVDHLHEHFVHPCEVKNGAYLAPTAPGFSIEMKRSSLATYSYRKEEAPGRIAADAAE